MIKYYLRYIISLNKGLYAYHFTNRCKELPDLELQDETLKVFLNASGSVGNISQELKDFLQFLVDRQANNKFTNELEKEVQAAQKREQWRLAYMTLWQKQQESFEQGFEQGIERGSIQMLISLVKEGALSIEMAAAKAKMSVEEFQRLIEDKK